MPAALRDWDAHYHPAPLEQLGSAAAVGQRRHAHARHAQAQQRHGRRELPVVGHIQLALRAIAAGTANTDLRIGAGPCRGRVVGASVCQAPESTHTTQMAVVSEAALAFALSLADGADAVDYPTTPPAGHTHASARELDLMERRFAELEERLDQASPKPVVSAPVPRRTLLVVTEGSAVSEALASVHAQAQAAAELAATLAEAEKSRKSSGGDATVFHVGSPETQPQQPGAHVQAVLSEVISDRPSPAQLDLHQAKRLEAMRARLSSSRSPREMTVSKTEEGAIAPSPARTGRTQEELKAIYARQKGVQVPQKGVRVLRQETQHRTWAPDSGYEVLSDFDFADALKVDEQHRPLSQAVSVVPTPTHGPPGLPFESSET